jgi:hypothetical protein
LQARAGHFLSRLLLTAAAELVTLFPSFTPVRTKEGLAMFYQTEAKPQGWRAVAIFDDRGERLIFLGRSSTQVRAGFVQAYFEVLDDEEREHVRGIALQRWHGAPDAGRWLHQTNLNVPQKAKLARSA